MADSWEFEVSIDTKRNQLKEKQQQLQNLQNAVAVTQREIDLLTGMIRGMEEVAANADFDTGE